MATQDKMNRAINDGDRLDAGYFNALATLTPIGVVVPWLKSFTSVPSLPDGWLECDGSVISDSDSPLNGETLPNLNGNNYFMRGNSTSGGTGGEATHTLTESEIPAHTHTLATYTEGTNTTTVDGGSTSPLGTATTASTGGGAAHNNEPQYYDAVWIMRIK